MTTNERLYDAGLLESFGKAPKRRDRIAMIAALNEVELADEADHIVDTVLANPEFYGF
jgi:hypothetical protein